jgi:WD40 repeat protein/energy-coupling factor transporter ATP-binding protein EcfA2
LADEPSVAADHGSPTDPFAEALIAAYVDDPRFVARSWLLERVWTALDRPHARFVLLTGEPGSGKSALVAHLARMHPRSPRYFIRRDSVTAGAGGDARAFLFSVGDQLARLHPSLFDPQRLEIVVRQRAERVASGGRVVGIQVEDLRASPFYTTALEVTQSASVVEGTLVGIEAARATLEPRLLDPSNLQYLALLDPARALADQEPGARIVVLVDALDEVRYGPRGEDVLGWLAACPELPENVRLVLTSRPDPDLLSAFRQAKAAELVELTIDPDDEEDEARIREDLGRFLENVAAEPVVTQALQAHAVEPASFVAEATVRAEGNFQYAVALARGIDHALAVQPPADDVPALLRLEGIPAGTGELYHFFLSRIKAEADRAPVQVSTGPLAEPEDRPAWAALYFPILAVLAVALEPLAPERLQAYAAAPAGGMHRALEDLAQFLDHHADGRYRLYHATFPEFLVGESTAAPDDPFHVDAAAWHGLLAGRLLRANPDWTACTDLYALTHTPAHLAEAIRLNAGQPTARDELSSALASLLTNFDFLEAKCATTSVHELEADYRLALESDPATPAKKLLQAFEERLRLESNRIARASELLFPHLYNHLVWLPDGPIAAVCRAAAAKRSHWIRLVQNPRPADPPWRIAFEGHADAVTALAVTADGGRVVSASDDRTLLLWDLDSGGMLRVYEGHTAKVRAAAVADDRIVSGDYDGTLMIWELTTGRLVRSIDAHAGPVTAVACAPGGDRVVSASADRTLKIFELATGRLVRPLAGHKAAVTALAVTPDGRSVVSAAEDYTLKLWGLATGRLLHSLDGHEGAVTALALSRDGRRAVSTAEDGTLRIWALASGGLVRSLPEELAPPEPPEPPFPDELLGSRAASSYRLINTINAVALVSDRRATLGDGRGTLETWDLHSGQVVRSIAGHANPVTALVATPHARRLVSGSWDHSLKVWNPRSGRLLRTLAGHSWVVTAVAVTPDGKHLVSASMDETVKVWDLGSGRLVRSYDEHTANVSALAITPDGSHVLSAGADRIMRFWNLASGRSIRELKGHDAWIDAVAVTPDGRHALSGAADGALWMWELASGRRVRRLDDGATPVAAVAISADGELAVSSAEHMVKLWDLPGGRLLHTFEDHEDDVRDLAITPDGRYAISASDDQTLRLWDLSARAWTRTFEGHSDAVTAVAVTDDGRHILSGSNDTSVGLWELASARLLKTFEIDPVNALAPTRDARSVVVAAGQRALRLWDLGDTPTRRALEGHTDRVLGLAMTPDGRQVLSASFDRTLRLWNASDGRLVRTYRGHDDRVTSVAITRDGQYAVSGSHDETVRVWELATARSLATLDGHWKRVWTVAVTPDGLHAVSGSRDHTVMLWELRPGRRLHTFEGHTANVIAVAVTPNGRAAVSISRDTTFKVWDLRSREMIRSVDAHEGPVSAVAITPDGGRLLTASYAVVKVWELASGRCLQELSVHTDWVTSLALTPDGQSFVSSSEDQTLRVTSLAGGRSRVLFANDTRIRSVAMAGHGGAVACGDDRGRVWLFQWMEPEHASDGASAPRPKSTTAPRA